MFDHWADYEPRHSTEHSCSECGHTLELVGNSNLLACSNEACTEIRFLIKKEVS